ncbi:MAG: hypothetical protein OEY89_11390 [Gammaproteobacteria bacterium]|nr:hypothetical protein [Gammaproteobacteria bacterium]
MKIKVVKWFSLSMLSMVLLINCNIVYAESVDDYSSTMSREKFEKTINRQFQYINERLLSEKTTGGIANSNNEEAVELLKKAIEIRDEIAKQIEENKYEEAYNSLQKINSFLSDALKISRSKERLEKKIIDDMEHSRIVNDAYLERVKKRFVGKYTDDSKAIEHYKNAIIIRDKADKAKLRKEYQTAIDNYHESTELLKIMISLVKKADDSDLNEVEEKTDAAEELFGY